MKILIADDDETVRVYLAHALKKLGHQIIECSDGRRALELLSGPEAPKLALLDWEMPELTGLEVCLSIKKNRSRNQPYLILLTAKDEKNDIITGLRSGANDYVTKPIKYAELITRIDVGGQLVYLQKLLEEQELKMISSSKMASLGQMAGGIAHEINNPLAIILGGIEQIERLISDPIPNTSKIREKCTKLKSTVMRITKIISGLKAFSGEKGNEAFVRVPIENLINDSLSFCEEKFKSHGIDIRLPKTGMDLTLECKPVQICQVLVNLLNNSYLAVKDLVDRWVKFEVMEQDEFIFISVMDSGFGIPPEIKDRIMEPFFTTRSVGNGTGLGLSISKGIIESHDGKIWLEEKSLNTCFIFKIPKVQKKISQAA